MKLTPQVLKKLHAQPLEVRLWNGNFNRCQIKVDVNRRNYQIDVSGTHPSLKQFVCTSLIDDPVSVWYNYTRVKDIPNELLPLIEKMKEAVKMNEEYAKQVYNDNVRAIMQFRKDFCLD